MSALIKPGILNAFLFTDKTLILFSPRTVLQSHDPGEKDLSRPEYILILEVIQSSASFVVDSGNWSGFRRREGRARGRCVFGDSKEHLSTMWGMKERKRFCNGIY